MTTSDPTRPTASTTTDTSTTPGTDTTPGPRTEADGRGPAPEDGTVRLAVNGESRSVPAGTTLDLVVAELSDAPSGVAAAVNDAVVPRGRWAATRLHDGDRVEVLTAVQGG